jgi:hypothetical protein
MMDANSRTDPIPMVVTARDENPRDQTVLVTPGTRPNILVQTMTPVAQVLVRGARTFLQSLVGFLLVVMAGRTIIDNVGVMIPAVDFLDALKIAASLAVAPTVISLLQNLVELLSRLDEVFPKARA